MLSTWIAEIRDIVPGYRGGNVIQGTDGGMLSRVQRGGCYPHGRHMDRGNKGHSARVQRGECYPGYRGGNVIHMDDTWIAEIRRG